jgi:branched-chain amino acid transport system ATP-binding protein
LPPEEPTAPVLKLEGVVRRFGGLVAVDGVSLTLGPRRRLAVIGPNGAGKTTLFRLIAGDMAPSEGRVHLFGRDVTRMPAHRRARLGLSRTFQVTNLFSGLSVLDNVRLAVQARTSSRWRFLAPIRPGDQVGTAAREALERVGIGARAHDRVADLSHGEQRQLEVAMALATEPRLLLLDEPAAGLSAGERARLRDLLESLPRSLPLLLIEHDMRLALSLADEVLCLHNGRQIAHGPPGEVRDDATVQAVYLGRAVDA